MELSEQFSRAVVRRLASLREARGISRGRLAQRSGISRSMISMMESGQRHPTLVTLHALAFALDVPLDRLIADTQAEQASGK